MDERKLLYHPVEIEIVNILSAEIITTSTACDYDSGGWT